MVGSMQVVSVRSMLSEMGKEEEMAAVIFKRFGDEQSTLLDKYERLSFEVQLNQAILGRSLSEPAVARRQPPPPHPLPPKLQVLRSGKQGRRPTRGLGFQKAVKKVLSSITGRKGARKDDEEAAAPNAKDPIMFWNWKAFSRSLRV